jgi:hypothetical protein
MNARIAAATMLSMVFLLVFCGILPAKAADSQLLNLVMPDAKVVAGVNVDQARTSPFGQFVISQIQAQQQQNARNLTALTGFDPTKDVSELLVASGAAPGSRQGLVLARGMFDPGKIAAAATAAGALTESYGGLTIVEDPKQQGGFAFLGSSYVVAGDIADVKAAIDRQKTPSALPASFAAKIGQWSTSEDAWVISIVPPSTLKPPAATPNVPGIGANGGNAFQNIQSAAAGVKFGANVVVTAQAEADNAQDATTMAGVLQLLVNLARTQAAQNAQLAALANGLVVNTQGSQLNVTFTLTEDQLQQLMNQRSKPLARPAHAIRRM